MKHINKLTIFIAFLSSILLLSCGSSKTIAEKAKQAQELNEQISNFDFKFLATYAYPTSYGSIYLSPYYDVTVSADTVSVYLPYYGRAYSAPMDPRDGGIKFESTDFEYEVEKGDKKGNWLVTILTKDTPKQMRLYFNLWDNGTGRLDVQDPSRQSISFQGTIEPRKENK